MGSMEVGDDGRSKTSGDHLRKGTTRFELSKDPLDAWTLKVDRYSEVLLLGLPMALGMASIGGLSENSRRRFWWSTRSRGTRGTGRIQWSFSRVSGGVGSFIGDEGRQRRLTLQHR
jgi:hypothetical protein